MPVAQEGWKLYVSVYDGDMGNVEVVEGREGGW